MAIREMVLSIKHLPIADKFKFIEFHIDTRQLTNYYRRHHRVSQPVLVNEN